MQLEMSLTGLAELDKKLAELGAQTGGKVLRSAMLSATLPLVKDMKSRVPVRSGGVRDSIRRKVKLDKQGKNKINTATVMVGAISGGKKGQSWFKAHFLEHGYHAVGRAKRTRERTKGRFIAPKPFIRPAFDAGKEQVVERFSTILKKRIEKAAK